MGGILVVYDTTAFRGHSNDLDHPTLVAIRDGRTRLGYTLVIPEVVVVESLKQQMDALGKDSNKGRDALNKFAARSGVAHSSLYDEQALNAALRAFPAKFRARIESEHDGILPLPQPSVESLLERDLHRKRPFGGGQGKGLRDYLIWLSILDAKKKTGKRIVFVSANTKDFSLDGALAPDYTQDLRDMGEPEQSVMLVQTPEEFLDEWIKPSDDETSAAHGKTIIEGFGDKAAVEVKRSLVKMLEATTIERLFESCEGDFEDGQWILDDHVELTFAIESGPVERVFVMSSGERMIDFHFSYRAIIEHDDRDRPDDPFDYYEVAWQGKARFIMAHENSKATAMRILSTKPPTIGEISDQGNWALEARDQKIAQMMDEMGAEMRDEIEAEMRAEAEADKRIETEADKRAEEEAKMYAEAEVEMNAEFGGER